jgi:hypothetical protein
MPVHALQQQGQQPGLIVNFMGKFTVDDEDDEEFKMDPLDWLLDDEADVAEEEALLKLVEPSVEALSDLGTQDDPPTTAAAAAATSRRRTQREAARRAAERIAAKQQQQWLLEQQQQHWQLLQGEVPGLVDGAAGPMLQQQQLVQPALQPLIPATAAGDVQQQLLDVPPAAAQQQAAAALAHGPGLGDTAGWVAPGMWQHHPVPGVGAGGQHQHQQDGLGSIPDMQQQHMQDAAGKLHESWDASGLQQQQPHHAVLTIRAEQLQQLYQQVSLHTQMLTQLYVMTAVDPSPAAQAMASAVGQMLEQMKRLHAVSTASLRGQQLGQLVQHAFLEAAGSSGGGNGAVPLAMRRLRGHQPGLVWQPPLSNMQ